MDILSLALPWADLGWDTVVLIVVLLILRGNLVPKSFHDQIVDDRDHWRGIAEELQKENTKLLITGELGVSSIMAIEQRIRDAEQRGQDKEAQL